MALTCSSTELATHQTFYSQTYRKANKFQKLTEADKKVGSVKRCVHPKHVADSQVRCYQLTRLLSVANWFCFGQGCSVGINMTSCTTVGVLLTVIVAASWTTAVRAYCTINGTTCICTCVCVCVFKLRSVELSLFSELPSTTSYRLIYHVTRHNQPTTHKQGKAVAESGKMIGVRKWTTLCNINNAYSWS